MLTLMALKEMLQKNMCFMLQEVDITCYVKFSGAAVICQIDMKRLLHANTLESCIGHHPILFPENPENSRSISREFRIFIKLALLLDTYSGIF